METKINDASASYADERLRMADATLADSNYSRHTKMGVQLFCGSDIEQAFEDGIGWLRKNVWHDSDKEQPTNCRTVVIYDPSTNSGDVLSRCVSVNEGRKWAYLIDLLPIDYVLPNHFDKGDDIDVFLSLVKKWNKIRGVDTIENDSCLEFDVGHKTIRFFRMPYRYNCRWVYGIMINNDIKGLLKYTYFDEKKITKMLETVKRNIQEYEKDSV